METITTTISVPDRAAVGFGATLDVAYRYSEVNKVDQDALALEGKTLKTGASPVRLPFRMHVVPIDEHTCEVGLEVDFDTTSPQQVEANETFIALLREAIPATIRDRETNPPATVQPDHASPPSMFDRLGPQQLARLFKHLTIPTAMIGLLGLLASIVIFAQAAEGTTITQLGVGPNGTAITESLPGHGASAIVVILALGGELLATVIAVAILLFFGYAIELLAKDRGSTGAQTPRADDRPTSY
jgi:hypothetical protein